MTYAVELLGGLRVIGQAPDAPVTRFRTRKTGLLLSYLALHPTRRQAREKLIELFWPDLDLPAGRDNLSTCLSQLRRQFAGTAGGGTVLPLLVQANHDAVWLNQSEVTTDVARFERELDRAAERDQTLKGRRAHLEAAIACYKGPLLPDVYEDWALSQQSRLAQRYALALAALADVQAQTGAPDLALATARRAQQADPFAEAAYQTEMGVLARRGEIEAARRVYDRFAASLDRELACRPSPTLQQFVQRLENLGAVAVEAQPPDAESVQVPPAPAAIPNAPAVPASRVPAPLAQFLGREAEVEQVRTLLQRAGSPLVMITGPGGIGKTHLALFVAARLADANPGKPMFWVPLADVSDARLFLPTLRQAVGGAPAAPDGDDVEALAEHLRSVSADRGAIVLLDNLEQLIGDDAMLGPVPALIRVLRERVPNLTILGTSRRILGLAGEQEVLLGPLPVPPPVNRSLLQAAQAHLTELGAVPSVALFVERARLVQPDFTLTLSNAEALTAICRRLEGLPLALEIAAAWVRTLPLSQIQQRLEAHLFALQGRRRDLPARHRSLQATVAWSWELLDADLRRFFLGLCVFRGGCTLADAEAVAGNDDPQALDWLTRLQEHSLLTVRPDQHDSPRYGFLEPIRQWGVEKLAEDTAAFDTARRAHARHFLALYTRRDRPAPLDEQNCRAACDELLRPQPNHPQEAAEVADGLLLACQLCEYWYDRGLHLLAYQYLAAALDRYRSATQGTAGEQPAIFARALHYVGAFLRAMDRLDDAEGFTRAAKEQYLAIGDEAHAAACEGELGIVAEHRQDYDSAAQSYSGVVEIARRGNNPRLLGSGLMHLGSVEKDRGNYAVARAHYDEALALFRQVNNPPSSAFLLLLRSVLLVLQNQFADARNDILDGLDLAAEINNPRLQSHLIATAAALAARTAAPAVAVTLQTFADRLIAESGSPLNENERRARAALAYTTESLSPAAHTSAETQGRTATLSDIRTQVGTLCA